MLSQAVQESGDPVRNVLLLELGDLCYELDKFEEAVRAYRSVVDTTADNSLLRKYLISLYNSGRHGETLRLAQGVRGDGAAIPIISELECLVLEGTGELVVAENLRRQLSEAEPDKPDHIVHLALIFERNGDKDRAAQILDTLTLKKAGDNPNVIMGIARLRDRLGLPDVLPWAYRARQLGSKDPQIHLFYVCAFLRQEDDESLVLEPNKVEVGCTVHLTRGDEKLFYHIVDNPQVDPTRMELAVSNATTQMLLRKTVGTEVELLTGPFEEVPYVISEIQSSYVFAFQETLRNFANWFPGEKGLISVKEEPGKIDNFLRFVGIWYLVDSSSHNMLWLGA